MTNNPNDTSPEQSSAIQGTISRKEIEGTEDMLGVILPTTPDGIDFLRENNAWGFVAIAQEPEFAAMYVTGSAREVQYFAYVDSIVAADEVNLAHQNESYPRFDPRKKAIVFKPKSLYKLKDPIPYREKTPYSLRYTELRQFREATGTDELF